MLISSTVQEETVPNSLKMIQLPIEAYARGKILLLAYILVLCPSFAYVVKPFWNRNSSMKSQQ